MGEVALVTGANGVIGPSLIRSLLSRGYDVRALDCVPPGDGAIGKAGKFYACDLADKVGLEEAVAGTGVVFHLAAKLHIANPTERDREEYWTVNVEGTRNLVEAANKAGVKRLVFFSTINVYGSTESGVVCDENSPTRPDSFYSETKLEGEKIVFSGCTSVVLRMAAVYGPRMKGNYPRLVKALERGHFVMIGVGENRRTLVHLQDVCNAALLAAEHPEAVGHIYNVTDGRVHTLKEVIAAICNALGKQTPRFIFPVGVTRLVFGLTEDAFHWVGRKPPLRRSTIDKFIEDLAVSGDRVQRQLGFRPEVELIPGWRDAIKQMRV
jgi:UDP-glucose 4-epimerase